ncbi:hypothetical protein JL721_1535 [Aureococcus anophagefferens]|nr:hypothetical protein JL721_1535 [Aureococcus anophagefferens]
MRRANAVVARCAAYDLDGHGAVTPEALDGALRDGSLLPETDERRDVVGYVTEDDGRVRYASIYATLQRRLDDDAALSPGGPRPRPRPPAPHPRARGQRRDQRGGADDADGTFADVGHIHRRPGAATDDLLEWRRPPTPERPRRFVDDPSARRPSPAAAAARHAFRRHAKRGASPGGGALLLVAARGGGAGAAPGGGVAATTGVDQVLRELGVDLDGAELACLVGDAGAATDDPRFVLVDALIVHVVEIVTRGG